MAFCEWCVNRTCAQPDFGGWCACLCHVEQTKRDRADAARWRAIAPMVEALESAESAVDEATGDLLDPQRFDRAISARDDAEIQLGRAAIKAKGGE